LLLSKRFGEVLLGDWEAVMVRPSAGTEPALSGMDRGMRHVLARPCRPEDRMRLSLSMLLLVLCAACGTSHGRVDPDSGVTPDGGGIACGLDLCGDSQVCCAGCTEAESFCQTPDLPCPAVACPPPVMTWRSCEAAMAATAVGQPCDFFGGCGSGTECCFESYSCVDGMVTAEVGCGDDCEPPTECGTRGSVPCPAGQFCDFSGAGTSGACGAADGGGVCRVPPDGCDDIYAPVCGCDRFTYGNDCEAAASGVSVLRVGECEEPDRDCRDSGCPTDSSCQPCWDTWACLPPGTLC